MRTLADELFKDFREHSVSEFFRKNAAMLGYTGKIRSLTTVVHEGVTNAIDAAEEASILPDVTVTIKKIGEDAEHFKVVVEDNASGIPEEFIPDVFGKMLAGTKLHRHMQARGQQGIGICLPYESIISLSNGDLMPIGELVENSDACPQLLSYDADNARMTRGKIVARVKNPPSTKFIRITTYGGLSLTATPDHLLPVMEGTEVRVLKAAEVRRGMLLKLGLSKVEGNNDVVYTYKLLDPNKFRVYDRRALFELFERLKTKYGSIREVARRFGIPRERLRGWIRKRQHTANPSIYEFEALARDVGYAEDEIAGGISKVGTHHCKISISPVIDEEFCWFMGILASDGHIGKYKSKWGTSMSVSNTSPSILQRVRLVLEKLGIRYRSYTHKGTHLHFASNTLAEIAHAFGIPENKKSRTIKLSSFVLRLPSPLLASYLRGLFDGDGCISSRKKRVSVSVSLTAASETLIKQLQLVLLTRFGIFASMRELGLRGRRYFALTIEGREFLREFVKEIGFTDHPRMGELKAFIDEPRVGSYFCKKIGGGYWIRVRKVDELRLPPTPTYDLMVNDHPCFVANGIVVHNSGSVMFGQITSGKPVSVTTSTGNGEVVRADVMIDVDKNEGRVVNSFKARGDWRGTRVEFELKEVTYVRSRYGPFNYLRMTAIANPHVRITFVEPDGTLTVFERATEKVPEHPKPLPLHPWGVMSDDLLALAKHTKSRTIAGFLIAELSRVTKAKVGEISRISGVNLNKRPSELTWEDAERIVTAFKQIKFMAPPTEGLRPIGATEIESGMRQILQPEFVHAVTRPPKVYRGGLPFMVEVGVAYGGKAGKAAEEAEGEEEAGGMELLRFANRAPLIFDQGGCAITSAAHSIDWRRYGVDPAAAPLSLFVHVISAYVPYTSAGKQSIADEPEVYEEIRAATMEAARELRRFLYRKIRVKERQQRAGLFEQYLPVIAKKAANLAGVKEPDVGPLLKKIAGVGDEGES